MNNCKSLTQIDLSAFKNIEKIEDYFTTIEKLRKSYYSEDTKKAQIKKYLDAIRHLEEYDKNDLIKIKQNLQN